MTDEKEAPGELIIKRTTLRRYILIFFSQALLYTLIFGVLSIFLNDLSFAKLSISLIPAPIMAVIAYYFSDKNRNVSLSIFLISLLWGILFGVILVKWVQIALMLLVSVVYCIGLYFIENKTHIFIFTVIMVIINILLSIYLVLNNSTVQLTNIQKSISILTTNSAILMLWYLIGVGKEQTRNLAEARTEKQSALETLKALYSTFSHDFRNELGPPAALASSIGSLKGLTPSQQFELLEIMLPDLVKLAESSLASIETMENQLTSVLYIARLSSGSGFLKIEVNSLSKIVSYCTDKYDHLFKKKNITVVLRKDNNDNYEFWGDEFAIQSVVTNIINNCIKYTEKDFTTVNINLYRDSGYIRLSIEDQGIGIPREKIDTITNRFERAYTEYRPTKGFGIGLSTVKDYMELHQGILSCESEEGVGSRFTLSFPMIPIHSSIEKYDILIFDDDMKVHYEFYSKISEKYKILHVFTLNKFYEQINLHNEIKTFIIDIMMNDREDGIQAIKHISYKNSNARIIVHSVYKKGEIDVGIEFMHYKKSDSSIEQIINLLQGE